MARYIDADKLVEMYERSADDEWNKKTAPSSWAEAFDCAIADIDDQPTADVAPRAEVAREICCKIEEEIVAALESNYRARGEQMAKDDLPYELVALINGKINALRGIEGFVEELKKKYTEGNNESQNT